ncbi:MULTISPECIES: DUF7144 family membrane protein [Streptomyces]|uniref:Integral membrane protein n=2 Tax=Streptomyces griseus TaxID=1911 RepID=B1VYJ9_STRGG|nr:MULTISPECIES: hypothetical protein [Streptomyces]MYR12973.1 hypothetical protein [Streptomyces sp. SID724]MYR52808.1 hypothetical protein [Streptomyces sp. SID4928]MYT79902.1 hypothetical protein [Streptomyces sp. SID8364]EGE44781.1 putative integral membrane protein [Streptomyces sp. ACT-1]NEB56940.1 hypothetical protein [Streptomyces griseus]
MSQPSTPAPGASRPADPRPGGGSGSPWAAGGTVFAGVLLFVDGVLGVLKGIAGIASNDVYTRINDYVFKFSVTSWGWIHLVLGVILILVGWGILSGAAWARAAGVVLASLNLIANFMWLPYTPVWAIVTIAIDVFVIWALCTDRSNPRDQVRSS